MSESSPKPDSTVYPVLSCISILHNQSNQIRSLQAEKQQLEELLSSVENELYRVNERNCFLENELYRVNERNCFLENELYRVNERNWFLEDKYQELKWEPTPWSNDGQSWEDCLQSDSDE